MSEVKINTSKLKSDINKFRISLIILTIFQLIYLLTIVGSFALIVKYKITDSGIIYLWIFLILAGTIILGFFKMIFTFIVKKYERKNIPITQKKNNDNFLMIMFTGIIGLWLWLPNKKETDQIIKKVHQNNDDEDGKTIVI